MSLNVKALVNLLVLSALTLAAEIQNDAHLAKNPCCSMPCQHRGICNLLSPDHYECDCPKGYYGNNCEKSTFLRWLLDKISLDQIRKLKLPATGKLVWGLVNNIPMLHDVALRYVYLSGRSLGNSEPAIWNDLRTYTVLDGYLNGSFISTGLPPVPEECPTPLGVKGPKTLPKVNEVFDKLLRRKEFKPCPFGTNLMFVTFAQYLAHEFFKTGLPVKSCKRDSELSRRGLRSWVNGKLKSQIINGEEYPPYLKDLSEVFVYYPSRRGGKNFPQWAVENEKLGSNPLLFTMATIWLREHNRVCDVLMKEHPDWNDDRLYKAARFVLLGELLTITAGEHFQHLAQYRLQMGYKPNLFNGQAAPSGRMNYEFNLAFQWEHMFPDILSIHGTEYNMTNLLFGNNRIVFEHGLDAIVDSMCRNPAGHITYQNCAKAFEETMKQMIEEGRRMRLHSLNDYRKFYDLQPYESFTELVGDEKMAEALEELYGEVDAVEFVVGLFVEKHVRRGSVAPPLMIFLTGPIALREIMNNPIGSPSLWRPSTFGGKAAFDIVQKASLRKLFCLNLKGNCRNNVWVSFHTPGDVRLFSKRLNSEMSHRK